MSVVRRERAWRWTAVVAGVAALCALPALVGAAPAPSTGSGARQTLAMALRSDTVAYSGLAEVDGHLGLPTLPFFSGAAPLLDQTNRVRVWWGSPTVWRTDTLALTGQRVELSEPGGSVTYDYEANTVIDRTTTAGLRLPMTVDLLPPSVARTLLAWVGPTDRVTALPSRRVAGVVAAGVEVVPSDSRASLGRLAVWVDPASSLPVEVDVYARGDVTPTFRTRLLDLGLGTPAPDVLHPVLPTSAAWSTDRRNLVAAVRSQGNTVYPQAFGGLPALTDVRLAAGVASYGVGYARVAVLQLPARLVPRFAGAVGSAGSTDSTVAVAQQLALPGARAALLGSSLLQVALVITDHGPAYVVAGTVTAQAMTNILRAGVPTLATLTRPSG